MRDILAQGLCSNSLYRATNDLGRDTGPPAIRCGGAIGACRDLGFTPWHTPSTAVDPEPHPTTRPCAPEGAAPSRLEPGNGSTRTAEVRAYTVGSGPCASNADGAPQQRRPLAQHRAPQPQPWRRLSGHEPRAMMNDDGGPTTTTNADDDVRHPTTSDDRAATTDDRPTRTTIDHRSIDRSTVRRRGPTDDEPTSSAGPAAADASITRWRPYSLPPNSAPPQGPPASHRQARCAASASPRLAAAVGSTPSWPRW